MNPHTIISPYTKRGQDAEGVKIETASPRYGVGASTNFIYRRKAQRLFGVRMKKLLFLFFLILLIFTWTTPIFFAKAAARLEIEYPPIEGFKPTITTAPPEYVKYIFNFAIWAAGIIALGVLIYGGFRYLTSAGSPEKVKDAKDRILSALLGLVILFGSYLILVTINPQIVDFHVEAPSILPPLNAGVYLCKKEVDNEIFGFNPLRDSAEGKPKEEQKAIKKRLDEMLNIIDEKCWQPASSGEIKKGFNDNIHYVYLISTNAVHYGIILYEKSKFGGQADIMYNSAPIDKLSINAYGGIGNSAIKIKPSSVRIFILDEPRLEALVTLFEKIDFNKEYYSKSYPISYLSNDFNTPEFYSTTEEKLGSVKIEGKLIVIFFKNQADCLATYWTGSTEIDVHIGTRSNLHAYEIGRWCKKWPWTWPCTPCMTVVSGGVL